MPRIRHFLQIHSTDCGPAALASVLHFHRVSVSASQLRRSLNVGRDGSSARQLIDVAAGHGIAGKGVRVGLEAVSTLPRASILFWKVGHFVVLDRTTAKHVDVVDPAAGRRRLSWEEFAQLYAGIALIFNPTDANAKPQRDRGPHAWATLSIFFPRSPRWLFVIVASALVGALGFSLSLATGWFSDSSTAQLSEVIIWMPLVICVSSLLMLCLHLMRTIGIAFLQGESDRHSTPLLFARLLDLSYDFFSRRLTGDLAHRIRASSRLRGIISANTVSATLDALISMVVLSVVVATNWTLGVTALMFGLIVVAIAIFSFRRQWRLSLKYTHAQTRTANITFESLDSMLSIKSLGAEPAIDRRWNRSFHDETNTGEQVRRHQGVQAALMSTIQFLAPLSILWIGAISVLNGWSSVGATVTAATFAMGFLVPVSALANSLIQLASFGPDLERLRDILDEPSESAVTRPDFAASKPIGIRAVNVSFAYPGGRTMAIHDVSVDAPAGSYIGVIGESGSGKTSLGLLLAGIYHPTAGEVLVDGQSLGAYDLASYRRSIGYVNQGASLFAGTIRENLLLGTPEASDADIRTACEQAAIMEVIDALPMRMNTLLGAGGAGLSGGQRQRIALARALVRRPQLLILDEATSAVDPSVERRILKNIQALGITVVVIGHRLSLLSSASTVLVLESGRVSFCGSVDELTATRGASVDVFV